MKGNLLVLFNMSFLIYPISFVVSLIKTRKPVNHSYMKGFYWYSLIALLVFILFLLKGFGVITTDFFLRINLISYIFHYYFFANFISKVIIVNHYNKIYKFMYYVFLILTIITAIFSTFNMEHRGFSLCVANIGLIVLSLFYYNYLFEENSKIDLYKEPAFWVITGIVLGMSFSIPSHSLSKQLILSYQEEITHWILIFGALGFMLMHLFFIKASFLCSVQPSKK